MAGLLRKDWYYLRACGWPYLPLLYRLGTWRGQILTNILVLLLLTLTGAVILNRLYVLPGPTMAAAAAVMAVLLLPLWLVCSAEEDLLEYVEAMRGFITPEELEEKRRELGLRRPAGK